MHLLINIDDTSKDFMTALKFVVRLDQLLAQKKFARKYTQDDRKIIQWEMYDDNRNTEKDEDTPGFTIKACWREAVEIEMPFPYSRVNNQIFTETTTVGLITRRTDWIFWNPEDKTPYIQKDLLWIPLTKEPTKVAKALWG